MIPIIFLLLSAFLNSNAEVNKRTMNGIDFDKVKGFEKNWKLVTVRYRNDNRELRFVYANKLAWQTMKKGKINYPDGATFAKVAYLSQPDPSFESSLGPSETRRFQFMVKNSKKYKEHRGWGYALFNNQGEINPEPVADQVNACSSCHDIVPERGYVFTWPLNQSPSTQKMYKFEMAHKEVVKTDLPDNIASIIPAIYSKALNVETSLNKHVFQGTLDELKPSLARLAVAKKSPVVFMSEDKKKFTIIYPEDLKLECDDEGVKGLFVVSVNSMPDNKTNKVHFCQSY